MENSITFRELEVGEWFIPTEDLKNGGQDGLHLLQKVDITTVLRKHWDGEQFRIAGCILSREARNGTNGLRRFLPTDRVFRVT